MLAIRLQCYSQGHSQGYSRSSRNLFTVACNCSILVIIILLLDTSFAMELLLDYTIQHYQILHTGRTCLEDVQPAFRLSIHVLIKELCPNKGFYVLIHISKTIYPIWTCSTSTCRSTKMLYFPKYRRKRATYIWGRYDPKTEIWPVFAF
jgi:hypothetical protein